MLSHKPVYLHYSDEEIHLHVLNILLTKLPMELHETICHSVGLKSIIGILPCTLRREVKAEAVVPQIEISLEISGLKIWRKRLPASSLEEWKGGPFAGYQLYYFTNKGKYKKTSSMHIAYV